MAQRPYIDVRTLREAKVLSQDMLATMAGVSVRSIRRMEAGERVSAETYRCVAAALDVMPDNQSGAQSDFAFAISGTTMAVPLAPSIPAFTLPFVGGSPVFSVGISVAVLVCVFIGWWFGEFSPLAMLGSAFFSIVATIVDHQKKSPERKAAIISVAFIVLGFEIMAWCADNYMMARIGHAAAICYGGAALAGIALSLMERGRRIPARVGAFAVSGVLAGLAIAPLCNIAIDFMESPLRVQRGYQAYERKRAAVYAKPEVTLREKWELGGYLNKVIWEGPMGPPKALPETTFDFDLYERQHVALKLCDGLDKPRLSACRQKVFDEIPIKMVPIPFSHWDVLKGLYAPTGGFAYRFP